MSQVICGLDYLHSRTPPVIHNDLKCANLLLTHDACIKIGDFGASSVRRDDAHDDKKGAVIGTILWMAPEVLQSQGKKCSLKSDVWSVGCCLVETATARQPWSEKDIDNVFHAWRTIVMSQETPALPDGLPEDIVSFANLCLHRDADERSFAAALLQHEMFKPNSKQDMFKLNSNKMLR